MITLLHGDNTKASRNALYDMRRAVPGESVTVLDGQSLDVTTLWQALTPATLLGTTTVVIIENLFKKISRKSKHTDTLIESLRSSAVSGARVILWESAEIPKGVVSSLGSHIVEKRFMLPNVLYQFLDSIKPGNAQSSLALFEQTRAVGSSELVFAMLIKRVRQLLSVIGGHIPTDLAPWQLRMLTSQVRTFTTGKLQAMYKRLLDIDTSRKSSITAYSLDELVGQLIVDI